MNLEMAKRIDSCLHDNGHENYGEGNICVECRANRNGIKDARGMVALYEALKAIQTVAIPIIRDSDNVNTFASWAKRQADEALALVSANQ